MQRFAPIGYRGKRKKKEDSDTEEEYFNNQLKEHEALRTKKKSPVKENDWTPIMDFGCSFK